jgi:myo-inositol-1(or 4)-monophosphatase
VSGADGGAGADAGRGAGAGAGAEADLLAIAVEAAHMAGGLLRERAERGAEQDVTSKSTPTDLVSEADLASQRAIRDLLAARRPDDGFIGEEEHLALQGASGLSWVVDPLDGTVNFLFGIPQWCVSVAVRDSEGVLAGAVYDPNRSELFTATRSGPALLAGPDGSTRVLTGGRGRGGSGPDGATAGAEGAAAGPEGPAAEPDALATAMVATGLAYDSAVRAAQAGVIARLAPRVRDIRRFGSAALDLTWTAAGRYDAYYERTVKQWDIAAGQLICERAGLAVLELDEAENLPWGILVAPPALAGALHALVAGGPGPIERSI